MIAYDQYIKACKAIRESQAIVDEYMRQSRLTTATRFEGVSLSDIKAVESKMMDGKKYISFQISGKEVQRMEEFSPGLNTQYLIEHAHYSYDFDKALKNLCNWFKRRGAKVKLKDFHNKFNYLSDII